MRSTRYDGQNPFTRKRAERQTFPEHFPRERVVIDPPTDARQSASDVKWSDLNGSATVA
ncbi:hypothetical protein [Bradyrhizobium erythrophlei]|jgi:hypothetical protein|uniref:hypothetical protein n=1 Tax=Bradyrhizobium erythrophlei TaxID=1437360 RepID=UPI0012AC5A11|nr:hypothetical protein [Bradyrhizobium erythrophlei]